MFCLNFNSSPLTSLRTLCPTPKSAAPPSSPLLLHRLRYGLRAGWPTQASHGSGAAGASECVFDASAAKDGLMGYRPHRTCCLQECSRRLFSQWLEGAADCSCNFGTLGSKQPLNSPSPLPRPCSSSQLSITTTLRSSLDDLCCYVCTHHHHHHQNRCNVEQTFNVSNVHSQKQRNKTKNVGFVWCSQTALLYQVKALDNILLVKVFQAE